MRLERLRRYSRALAIGLLLPFLMTLIPVKSYAITSGPSQEEFATFTPAQTSDMVNLYTGDFTYNIPLLTVPGPNGGYPVNLFYNSGANVNEAGSWVGYGWNLNVGAINRQLSGLPDDFNGEIVRRETHMKPSFGLGVDIPTSEYLELRGHTIPISRVGWSMNVYYNNYNGLGLRSGVSFAKGNFGLGLSYDSQNGIGIDASYHFGNPLLTALKSDELSASYNSRRGLQDISIPQILSANSIKSLSIGNNSVVSTSSMGVGASPDLSFGVPGSLPEVDVETNTTQINFDVKVGKEFAFPLFRVYKKGKWSGFAEWSKLVNDGVQSNPSFGYLYTQNAGENGLKDFNRSQLPYSKKVPNLAPSFYTYDLLSVSGEGVGGMFRPYRSTIDVLNTPARENKTTGHNVTLEFGKSAPPIAPPTASSNLHFGLGYGQTSGKTYSGIWKDESAINEAIRQPSCDDCQITPGFEPATYRLYGEQNGKLASEVDLLDEWEGATPVRPSIESTVSSPSTWVATGDFKNTLVSNSTLIAAANYEGVASQRTPKANMLQHLNDYEAYKFGFSRNLTYFDALDQEVQKFEEAPSKGSKKISEIIVTKNDGMRYVYGLPAMNKEQVDANFNVYPEPYYHDIDPENTPITNTLNVDVINESEFTDNPASRQYSSKTHLPAYAHSWLLTNIVSPDYADKTGNGPSIDDPGAWIEFKYKKVADGYKWREPYEGASLMKGMLSNPKDDMASYSYGEKELFYLDKIETATHVAIFMTSERDDAVGASDEATGGRGAVTGNKMHRLDEIRLYVKPEGDMPNFLSDVPIQTIKFTYAENGSAAQICKGIPSASSSTYGKLTLTEVRVTTDNSIRGSLSPYKFTYGDNPNFDRRNRDRWGNYQNNTEYGSNYPFLDFAYTNQYRGGSEHPAPAADTWQLTKINLPTGGEINVQYELDDYAYEMDKPATVMLDIVGTDADDEDILSADRFSDGDVSVELKRSRIYLKLPHELPAELAEDEEAQKEYIGKYYIGDLKQIYFKVLAQLKGGLSSSYQDYVSGYFELSKNDEDKYGVLNFEESIIWIGCEHVEVGKPNFNEKMHPIHRAILEHLRANRPELVYDYSQGNVSPNDFAGQIGNVIGSVLEVIEEAATIFMGFNRYAIKRGWGDEIYLNGRSVVRLQNGSGFTYGGGNRVKSVRMNNNWTKGAGADEYGQRFDYTIDDNDGRGNISSGVAITPKDTGGDECALLNPVDYKSSSKLISPFNLFTERPIMRNYYPGAMVGYRKVTVKSITDNIGEFPEGSISGGFAPITEHEFYTHKDFPVFESQTDLSSDEPIFNWSWFIIGGKVEKRIGRSQGYTVELNNMAGVQKSITKRTRPNDPSEEGTIISKIEYLYNTEEAYSDKSPNRLSSNVKIVGPSETLVDGKIGETYDIFHDFNENSQESKQFGIEVDLDLSIIPSPIPLFAPFGARNVVLSSTSVRTAVTHKIIYKTGILKAVRATDGMSTITTENVAFDRTTAQPVLTRATNEFKDYVYSYSQPAHWYYSGMGGAYQNLGVSMVVSDGASSGDVQVGSDNVGYFNVGDEVWVENEGGGGDVKIYVTAVNSSTIGAMDSDGNDVSWTGPRTLTIFRSGHRNLLTAAASSMSFWAESDVSETNPATLESHKSAHFEDRYQNLLNVSTSTFKDLWPADYCNQYYTDVECPPTETGTATDFLDLLNRIIDCKGLTGDLMPIHCYEPYITQNLKEHICGTQAVPNNNFICTVTINQDNSLTLTFEGYPGCSDCSCKCSLTFAAPSSGFVWGETVAFSNLTANTVDITANEDTQTISIVSNPCFDFSGCDPSGYALECDDAGTGNPFLSGEQGNWRPHESFAYKIYRQYTSSNLLREYARFEIPSGSEFDWSASAETNHDNGWVLGTRSTKYSPYGNLLEEQDALGNYSSVQFGYLKQLAVAVCKNSKYQEIGSDNFEDYDKDCTDHFKFDIGIPNNIVLDESHTGERSVEVYGGSKYPYMVKKVVSSESNCLTTFSPLESKKYIVSAWVKEKNTNGTDIRDASTYKYPSVDVTLSGGTQATASFKPSGEIVDGWQRIFGEVTIADLPNGVDNYFEVRLVNNAKDGRPVYFDDVRIHPFNGSMKTFVYSPRNLRLMATLDENNFATFYLRDQEGQVVKYNVETEKGIVSIKEGTRHLAPNN